MEHIYYTDRHHIRDYLYLMKRFSFGPDMVNPGINLLIVNYDSVSKILQGDHYLENGKIISTMVTSRSNYAIATSVRSFKKESFLFEENNIWNIILRIYN
jgi:hypothetical protein